MAFIEWDQSFSVGVKLIDAQHKKLFGLINDFYEVAENGEGGKDRHIEEVIHSLMAYVDFHFKTEEGYFDEFHYEKSQEHKSQHKFYEDKVKEFYDKYTKGILESQLKEEMIQFLKSWIMGHIKINDKEYTKCFNEHGLI